MRPARGLVAAAVQPSLAAVFRAEAAEVRATAARLPIRLAAFTRLVNAMGLSVPSSGSGRADKVIQ